MEAHISIYETLMYQVSSRLGNIGAYERSNQISDAILDKDLALKRMGDAHMCLYNRWWNLWEERQGNLAAEEKELAAREIQDCIQLSRLFDDPFCETFYKKEGQAHGNA